jgi:uncharacterized membrane protein (UPF0127 family)
MSDRFKQLRVGLVIVSVCLLGWLFIRLGLQRHKSAVIEPQFLFSLEDHLVSDFSLGNKIYRFEIVNSNNGRTQGLSDRIEIGSDGMLFVFNQPDFHSIWMKDMLFDLDLIWLKNEVVVDFDLGVSKPESGSSLAKLTIYQPEQKVNLLIEVAAGFVEQEEIKIGDELLMI